MFSLMKYAYIACNNEERAQYNTFPRIAVGSISVELCCLDLLEMANGCLRTSVYQVVLTACRLDHVDCLITAYIKDCCINNKAVFSVSVIHGSVKCLDYVLQIINIDVLGRGYTYSLATIKGNLECLQIMFHYSVPWDGEEIRGALIYRHAKCLRFFLENGCHKEEDEWIGLVNAAGQSDVACVEVLRSYGMPLSRKLMFHAYNSGNNDLLQYLVNNQCPNPFNVPIRRSRRILERDLFDSEYFI